MNSLDYTPDQKAAIECNSNMVITACPGSGKTTVIAEKIRNEVKNLQSYQGVIGITFTVKASKELKERCKKDSCDTKMSFFGTIDHFCLSEIIHPFFSKVLNKKKVQLECIKFDSVPQDVKDMLSAIPIYDENITSSVFGHFEKDIVTLFDHGYILLELVGVIANHVISKSNACQRYILARYGSVYVDEYQDSSEPQHALFLKLLELGLTCVAVGDVQQSIYIWRGSNPKFIKDLTDNVDVFEHHVIDVNHRCHPSIVNYSNRLFDEKCHLLDMDEIRVFRKSYAGTQLDVVDEINKLIEKIINKELVKSYSQIGILVRNNISLEFLGDRLEVPHRIFDEDPLLVRNTKTCNLFYQLLKFKFDKGHRLNDVVEYVQSLGCIKNLSLADLRKIISTLNDKDEINLSCAVIGIASQILDCSISAADNDLITKICLDPALLKHYHPVDENEVQVMTLHKSKGLEFEIVLHLDLYDWVFPKRTFLKGNYNVVYADFYQDLNLHFVGITRAKNYCVLVTSSQRINGEYETKFANKSQFLSLPGLSGLYK